MDEVVVPRLLCMRSSVRVDVRGLLWVTGPHVGETGVRLGERVAVVIAHGAIHLVPARGTEIQN